MFNITELKKIPICKNIFTDTEELTTPTFVKELRHKLVLSQRMMAKTLGLSEKTIEKWEEGANPVKGAASRLLYLLDKHPELIAELYQFQKIPADQFEEKCENKSASNKIQLVFSDCDWEQIDRDSENNNCMYYDDYVIEDRVHPASSTRTREKRMLA